MNRNVLSPEINDWEYLYRGVVEVNWDFDNNRPSSATFKDSKGVSVDRDGGRAETDCVNTLISDGRFISVCKISTLKVRALDAYPLYLPLENNIYHSEIHDSIDRVQLKGSKPKKLRDHSVVVYKKLAF